MTKTIKTNFVPDRSGQTKQSPLLLTVAAIAVVAIAFGAGWAWSKFTSPLTPPQKGGEMTEQPTNGVVTDEPTLEPTIVDDQNTLTIDWVKVDEQKARSTDYNWNLVVFGDQQLTPEDGIGPKAFGLGTVKGGIYDGYELQMYIAGVPSMGVEYQNFYLLVSPNLSEIIILDNYADRVYSAFTAPVGQLTASEVLGEEGLVRLAANENNQGSIDYRKLILDSGSKITELEQVDLVKDTDGRIYNLIGVWQRTDYPNEASFSEPTTKITLENGQVLNLYNSSDPKIDFANNLFYYIRPDGRTVWYDLELGLGMVNDEASGPQVDLRSLTIGVPQLTWSDGTKNVISYSKGVQGGCGTIAGLNVVDIKTVGELKEGGASAADKIYVPVSFDTEYFQQYFQGWKNTAPEGEVRETLEQFAVAHPFFYFQDSFDRWIQFMNTEILPMGECGKPVIYLYPEKTTDLDVQLYPQGGFTYTEPVYNNGWRVTASPDGTLVNRDDGQIYPYLFWEGRGGMYVSPNRYWVLKQSGVHDFLVSTLAKLGLNTKETADFIEFWEPRMQDASYYKIGFYGTSVMNQLAPLSISETPDTLIRILMDYQSLDAPIKANPPALLSTPERTGFTVVEWGGVLR